MSVPAAYLSVVFIWATTPLAIQWSGMEAGVIVSAGARMSIAAVLCLPLLWLMGVRLSWQRPAVLSYVAIALKVAVGIPLVYWSAAFIPSGLMSVMFGLSPLVTSIFAALWLGERSLTPSKLLGISFGILGLALIFRSELSIGSNGLPGLLLILTAVLVFSFSSLWIKRLNADVSALAMTTGGLWLSVPLYGLAWLLVSPAPPADLSAKAIGAILYLGVFGSVLGFIFFYYLLKHLDTSKVSLITLITPVLALLLGQHLNGEHPAPLIWFGSAVILLGLMCHLWGDKLWLLKRAEVVS